jgi:hypothetical protein
VKIVGKILRGNFTADVTGLPSPVINVSSNSTGPSERLSALSLAVEHHAGTESSDEEVCNTAMMFEYYLQHGEYPPG